METQSLYNAFVILIPAITVAGQELTNVYARIKSIYYDTQFANGVIGLKIGDTPDSQVTYSYEVNISIAPSSSISATELVQAVLGNIPNSSIYTPA
jgi:NOL1/NOP2/fmu family ribosome biogenesis protein